MNKTMERSRQQLQQRAERALVEELYTELRDTRIYLYRVAAHSIVTHETATAADAIRYAESLGKNRIGALDAMMYGQYKRASRTSGIRTVRQLKASHCRRIVSVFRAYVEAYRSASSPQIPEHLWPEHWIVEFARALPPWWRDRPARELWVDTLADLSPMDARDAVTQLLE